MVNEQRDKSRASRKRNEARVACSVVKEQRDKSRASRKSSESRVERHERAARQESRKSSEARVACHERAARQESSVASRGIGACARGKPESLKKRKASRKARRPEEKRREGPQLSSTDSVAKGNEERDRRRCREEREATGPRRERPGRIKVRART